MLNRRGLLFGMLVAPFIRTFKVKQTSCICGDWMCRWINNPNEDVDPFTETTNGTNTTKARWWCGKCGRELSPCTLDEPGTFSGV